MISTTIIPGRCRLAPIPGLQFDGLAQLCELFPSFTYGWRVSSRDMCVCVHELWYSVQLVAGVVVAQFFSLQSNYCRCEMFLARWMLQDTSNTVLYSILLNRSAHRDLGIVFPHVVHLDDSCLPRTDVCAESKYVCKEVLGAVGWWFVVDVDVICLHYFAYRP